MSEPDAPEERRSLAPSFLVAAGLCALGFALCHLLGLRECTTVLAGTLPPGGSPTWTPIGAALYLLAWFGLVLGAPICALAAALSLAAERWRRPA